MADKVSTILDYLILCSALFLLAIFVYQLIYFTNLFFLNQISVLKFMYTYSFNVIFGALCIWRIVVRVNVIMGWD